MVCSNTSMEYIPLYDTDKGFNDVGDVEFQDNWGRVLVFGYVYFCGRQMVTGQADESTLDVTSPLRSKLGMIQKFHPRRLNQGQGSGQWAREWPPELLSGNDVLWTFGKFAGEDHTRCILEDA
ncbi:hypothetical protein Tco_1326374 [Tanacetum coccineum]